MGGSGNDVSLYGRAFTRLAAFTLALESCPLLYDLTSKYKSKIPCRKGEGWGEKTGAQCNDDDEVHLSICICTLQQMCICSDYLVVT